MDCTVIDPLLCLDFGLPSFERSALCFISSVDLMCLDMIHSIAVALSSVQVRVSG